MVEKFNEANKDLDKGWALVVLFAATGASMLIRISNYAFSHLSFAVYKQLGYDLNTAFYLSTSFMSLGGVMASVIINLFSCRSALIVGGVTTSIGFLSSSFASPGALLVTHGIIGGIGHGLSTVPTMVVTGYFFKTYHGIAIGCITSGAGIATFVVRPLVDLLIMVYGIHGTYLILAAVSSNLVVLGALIWPSKLEFKHKSFKINMGDLENESSKCVKDVAKNMFHFDICLAKTFIFCCLQYCLWNVAYLILITNVDFYLIIQRSQWRILGSQMISIGLMVAPIITGLFIDKRLDPVWLNFGLDGIIGFLTILLPLLTQIVAGGIIYFLFMSFFGLLSGGMLTLINPLCMELLGVAKVSSGVGLLLFMGDLGNLIGSQIIGIIPHIGETPDGSIYLSGCLFLLSAVLIGVSTIWRQPWPVTTEEQPHLTNVIPSSSQQDDSNNTVSNEGKDRLAEVVVPKKTL